MTAFTQFLYMGGYAWFVWPAFGITFIVLLLNIVLSAREYNLATRDAKRFVDQKNTQRKAQHTGAQP